FSSETQAEFTAAEFVPEKEVLPELFEAALAECRRCSVKEVYTVVNPLLGFSKLNECGVRLSYAFSEYFLCCDINTLTGSAAESKERQEGEALKEAVLHRYEEADGAVRYCLAGQGQEAAECLVTPFDEGKMWYLFRLETKEEFRRQGFARRLLCETARELAAAGAEQIRLQVSSKNRPAETLYRQLGFWTEEQRDYYKTEEF
ncbi:MAG: GNAT family N-acetyltransferase, partial [Lachnospiraceae bacterium]